MTRYRLYVNGIPGLSETFESVHTSGRPALLWNELLRAISLVSESHRRSGMYVVREAGESS